VARVCELPPLLAEESAAEVPKVVRRASPRFYSATKWTIERQAELAMLWNKHFTCSHIARLMGLTRNQVIGRAHRSGLPRRAGIVPTIEVARAREEKRRLYLREYREERVHIMRAKREAKFELRVDEPPREYPTVATIVDLREDQCKFPVEDGMWCGRPRINLSSYCVHHHRRCHHKGRDA